MPSFSTMSLVLYSSIALFSVSCEQSLTSANRSATCANGGVVGKDCEKAASENTSTDTNISTMAAKLSADNCIDPDLSKLANDQSIMLCNGTIAQGTLVISPACANDGDGSCVVDGTTFKAAKMSNFTDGDIRNGVTIAGLPGVLTGAPSSCGTDGETGCLANNSFPSVDATYLTAGNIKKNVTIGTILGDYPSSTHPLTPGDAYTDLNTTNFDTRIKDGATTFGWFDRNGARFSHAGDSDLAAANLVSTANIFSVQGNVTVYSTCNTDGGTSCVANASYPAVNATNLVVGNIKKNVVLGGLTGTYPSSTAPLSVVDSATDLDTTNFNIRIKDGSNDFGWFDRNGARYTHAGDADIDENNILSTANIFGTQGVATAGAAPNAWDLRAGTTVSGVTGKLKVNCRNGGNLTHIDLSMPIAITVNATTDVITTAAAHGYADGDSVRVTGQTQPGGLAVTTTFYAIVDSTTTLRVAANSTDALARTNQVNISSAGANAAIHRWADGVMGTADTTDDRNNNTASAIASSPWTSDQFCTGYSSTATDAVAWVDVTKTAGNAASDCATTAANCTYQDKISGLKWTKHDGTYYRWGAAMDYCNRLTYNNETGWRVPTQKEAMDAYTHGFRSLGSANFIPMADMTGGFWSSTMNSQNFREAWKVNQAEGYVDLGTKDLGYLTVCVK